MNFSQLSESKNVLEMFFNYKRKPYKRSQIIVWQACKLGIKILRIRWVRYGWEGRWCCAMPMSIVLCQSVWMRGKMMLPHNSACNGDHNNNKCNSYQWTVLTTFNHCYTTSHRYWRSLWWLFGFSHHCADDVSCKCQATSAATQGCDLIGYNSTPEVRTDQFNPLSTNYAL